MLTFQALLDVARLVGDVIEGVSTSGSTTTLVDTSLPSTTDNYYLGGTLFVRSGVPNVNTSRVITAHTNSSRTVSFGAAAAIVPAQAYTICRLQYPRQALITAVNQALVEIGAINKYVETVTTVTGQNEYSLPNGVANVLRVEIASNLAAPWGFIRNANWDEEDGKILFNTSKAPTTTGYKLRIHYYGTHALVAADSDLISDQIHPERLAWTAAYYAALNRTRQVGKDDPSLKDMMALFSGRITEMGMRFPIRLMARTGKGSGF